MLCWLNQNENLLNYFPCNCFMFGMFCKWTRITKYMEKNCIEYLHSFLFYMLNIFLTLTSCISYSHMSRLDYVNVTKTNHKKFYLDEILKNICMLKLFCNKIASNPFNATHAPFTRLVQFVQCLFKFISQMLLSTCQSFCVKGHSFLQYLHSNM